MGYSVIRSRGGPDTVGVFYNEDTIVLEFKDNIASIPESIEDQDDFAEYLQAEYKHFFTVQEWKEMEEDDIGEEFEESISDLIDPGALGGVFVDPLDLDSETVTIDLIDEDEEEIEDEEPEPDPLLGSIFAESESEEEESIEPEIEPEEDEDNAVMQAILNAQTMDGVVEALILAGCPLSEDILFDKMLELRKAGVSAVKGKQNGLLKISVKRVLKKHN